MTTILCWSLPSPRRGATKGPRSFRLPVLCARRRRVSRGFRPDTRNSSVRSLSCRIVVFGGRWPRITTAVRSRVSAREAANFPLDRGCARRGPKSCFQALEEFGKALTPLISTPTCTPQIDEAGFDRFWSDTCRSGFEVRMGPKRVSGRAANSRSRQDRGDGVRNLDHRVVGTTKNLHPPARGTPQLVGDGGERWQARRPCAQHEDPSG
jgi:hypothetical protein